MVDETQLVIAGAGVCVLALVVIVLGRRRRKAAARTEARAEARTDDQVVEAVEATVEATADEPGRLVLARTHDGTQYQGVLAGADGADPDGAYLVLTGPIVYRRSGGEPETMPSAWDRLALPLADVAEVWTRPARVDGTEGIDDSDHARSDPTSVAQSRASRHTRGPSNAAVPTS